MFVVLVHIPINSHNGFSVFVLSLLVVLSLCIDTTFRKFGVSMINVLIFNLANDALMFKTDSKDIYKVTTFYLLMF